MGDNIDENVWEGEDEVDLTRTIKSDDEIASSDDEDYGSDALGNDKKIKKKRKFEAMKEKKRLRLASSGDDLHQTRKQMTPSLMLEEILANRPGDNDIVENTLQESDFFYPDLLESSTTPSTKEQCPFVRALSTSLPNYKKLLLNNSQTDKDNNGCPILVIICGSALRATEIIKSMSAKLIKVRIAKLFARHFKVQEQVEALAAEYFPVAIGTPNRIGKLIELGALSLRCTKVVLVDVTEDAKHYTPLTLKETQRDFYRLLHNDIQSNKSHLKIALIDHTIAGVNGPNASSSVGVGGGSEGQQQAKKVKRPFVDKKKKLLKLQQKKAKEHSASSSSSSSNSK